MCQGLGLDLFDIKTVSAHQNITKVSGPCDSTGSLVRRLKVFGKSISLPVSLMSSPSINGTTDPCVSVAVAHNQSINLHFLSLGLITGVNRQ